MFDVGFWELALIGVIALLVVGPDRLPGMARTVGFWVGRTRRYIEQVKRDVAREIDAEELRSALKGDALRDLKKDLEGVAGDTRDAVREVEADFDAATDAGSGSGAAGGGDPPEPAAASGAEPSWTEGIAEPVDAAPEAPPVTDPETAGEPTPDERRETSG